MLIECQPSIDPDVDRVPIKIWIKGIGPQSTADAVSTHDQAAKIILDLPIISSASEALNKLKWKTLARRRAEHRATFIYKCFK